jgi:hypothetical protein
MLLSGLPQEEFGQETEVKQCLCALTRGAYAPTSVHIAHSLFRNHV